MNALIISSGPKIAAIPRGQLFIPSVKAHSLPVAPQGEPLPVEQRLYGMMALHPLQERRGMVWDDLLANIAFMRCWDQATRGYTGHVDPDGKGANWWARYFGYQLPSWYSQDDDANNIESLSHGGNGTPEQTWEGFLNSPGHRIHVLGIDPFYAQQTQVGVGYYYSADSEYKSYWAVLSAPKAE